jgi:hypothetical protein
MRASEREEDEKGKKSSEIHQHERAAYIHSRVIVHMRMEIMGNNDYNANVCDYYKSEGKGF